MLKEAVKNFADQYSVILLIDALDECEPRNEIRTWLSELVSEKNNIKCLVASRDQLDISQALKSFERLRLEHHQEEIHEDICRYTGTRLASDPQFCRLSTSLKDEVAQCIGKKSLSMFRWAQCQLDSISNLKTVRAIHSALQDLPKGLDDTYAHALRKVPQSEACFVHKALAWLAFSVLPLTLEEIYEAIAIEPDTNCIDEENRLGCPSDILSLCENLVSISDRGNLTLAHLSVKDYLLSETIRRDESVSSFALIPGNARSDLAVDCLTYLQFIELRHGPAKSLQMYTTRVAQLPFLRHVATAWPYYAKECETTSYLERLIRGFFGSNQRPAFLSWVQVLNADYPFKWDLYPTHATTLYYAASFGMTDMVKHLIKQDVDLNAPGSRFGGTALHGAAWRGYLDAAIVLLENGAEPDRSDWNLVSPLHSVASCGNLIMINLLMKYGASPDVTDQDGEKPSDWALKGGYGDAQKLLLGEHVIENVGERNPVEEDETTKVWTYPKCYFPDWYDCRSGMSSSTILKVEVGSKSLQPDVC